MVLHKALVGTLMVLLFSFASTDAAIIDTFPDTTENIHVFQVFNFYVENPQDVLGKIDLVWGSVFPTEPKGVFNTYYQPFDRTIPQIIDGVLHDLAWFKGNHPDWIIYTCDRVTPAWAFQNKKAVPLDITNPAVREYLVDNYLKRAKQRGYKGIAFDNITLYHNFWNRCGIWNNRIWVQKFTGDNNDPKFREASLSYAAWMYNRLHEEGMGVLLNFSYEFNCPVESKLLYNYMDLAASERGFSGGQKPEWYYSEAEWLANMKALQELDEKGRGFAAINYTEVPFAQVTKEKIQFILANYLLVKGKHSYLAIQQREESGGIFIAPEYSAPIGHALNKMYVSQGVYMRDFSNGKAIVNPSHDKSFIVSLGGVYKDLYGNSVSSITLKPWSGIVLLERKSKLSPVLNLLLD